MVSCEDSVLTGSVCSPETQNSPSATWPGGRETSGLLTPSLAGAASFFSVLNTIKVCSNENSTAKKNITNCLEGTQLQPLPRAWPSLHPLLSPASRRRLGPLKAHPSTPPPPPTGQHPLFIPSHLFGPTTTAEHELGEASPIGYGSQRHTGPSSLVMCLDWGPEGFFRYRRGPPFPEES